MSSSGSGAACCWLSTRRPLSRATCSRRTAPGGLATSPSGIRAEGLDGWRRRLEGHGVVVEKEVGWPRGGRSIYFRDPAGNSVELVTPGLWGSPGGW